MPTAHSYLITLDDAVTLRLSRSDQRCFGLRLPKAAVWPLIANRPIRVQSHTQAAISVGWLSRSTLRRVMLSSPRLRNFFIERVLLADEYATGKLTLHLNNSAQCRLAAMLLELDHDAFPKPIQCGHNTLGIMLNLNRETVTALLNNFRRAGWVKLGYQKIWLIDRSKLAHVAEMF